MYAMMRILFQMPVIMVLLLRSFVLEAYGNRNVFEECYKYAIENTQRCDNKKPYYATHMGLMSGFGSEMNYYLAKALLLATIRNRRLIYFKSKLDWEYNCATKDGWACYLQFPCKDSVVEKQDMDFATLIRPGQGLMDMNEVDVAHRVDLICNQLKQVISSYNPSMILANGTNCNNIQCDAYIQGQHPDVGVKYLYHLNPETQAAATKINSKYKPLVEKNAKYFGLQIRLTDKKGEMSEKAWKWLCDLSNTANTIKPIMAAANLHRLFVAADDCGLVQDLKSKLDSNIHVFSPCLDHTGQLSSESGKHALRGTGEASAHAVIADIEMLRKSEIFAGLYDSNLVRLIHRVRGFDKPGYALAAETYDNPDQKNFNNKPGPQFLPWLG